MLSPDGLSAEPLPPPDAGRRHARLVLGMQLAACDGLRGARLEIGAAIGLTALLITSTAAQPPTGLGDGATPAVTVARGSLLRVQNNWRGRALIGTPVFDG